tara:strand:+ start:227 stop:1015 length:789 start_codon:yes stop_codon:yes gene_type:complete
VNEICSKFILKDVFDAYQDVYVSFETTSPIDINNGLVIFVIDPLSGSDVDINFLPGSGLGVIPSATNIWNFNEPVGKTITGFTIKYPNNQVSINWGDGESDALPSDNSIDHTYNTNIPGNNSVNDNHIFSIALDGAGKYGLNNSQTDFEFFGTNDTGIDSITPFSITTRALRDGITFSHLNTSTSIDTLSSITPNTYRVRLKGYLNKVYVDILQDGEYLNVYELNTNVKLSDISRFIKIGFSYSGSSEFGLKNITYSGQISS